MEYKTRPVTVKTAGPEDGVEEGVFEAIVAAYNVDSVNDRIVPGAFKESLAAWKSSGDPIPVLWSHKSDDPDYHIGYVLDAEERPEGLWVKAQIDLDEPKSRKIYKLLKGRRCRSFSFSYDILDARPGQKDDGSPVQELHRLGLHEIGPCLYPANRATSLLDVKSQPGSDPDAYVTATYSYEPRLIAALDAFETELKSAETDTKATPAGGISKPIATRIRRLQAAIQALADAVDPGTTTDSNAEKATPVEPADSSTSQAAPEAVAEVKAAEPAPAGTASVRLRTEPDLFLVDLDLHTI